MNLIIKSLALYLSVFVPSACAEQIFSCEIEAPAFAGISYEKLEIKTDGNKKGLKGFKYQNSTNLAHYCLVEAPGEEAFLNNKSQYSYISLKDYSRLTKAFPIDQIYIYPGKGSKLAKEPFMFYKIHFLDLEGNLKDSFCTLNSHLPSSIWMSISAKGTECRSSWEIDKAFYDYTLENSNLPK